MTTKQKPEFSTVDGYIALQPVERRSKLEELRHIIKKAAPGAEEVISYQMPAYKFNGMLAWFAAAKNHYGLYVRPQFLEKFKDQISPYKTGRATLQFPFDKPLPKKLITDIIKHAAKANLEKISKNKKR